MSALNTALTGLQSFQSKLDVIGNNIANLNTVGFKSSRADFQELLVQTVRGATAPTGTVGGINPEQIGQGVRMASVTVLDAQGTLNTTGKPTDVAIQGNGFFVLSDSARTFYTRAGNLTLDATGTLVDAATGLKVSGIGGASVTVPLGSRLAPQATTQAKMQGNLDAQTAVGNTVKASVPVFDSLGIAHDVTVTFTRSATSLQWDWSAALGTTNVGSGSIFFTAAGAFDATLSTNPVLTIPAAALSGSGGNGASALTVTLDMNAVTQTGSPSDVATGSQDGFTAGDLQTFSVGQDGTITGIYSNGRTKALGQLALAVFNNPGGLDRVGGNLFAQSANSGLAQVGAALSGGRGAVVGGALEQSNVDLTREFTEMIIAQRGFQANSRVITTGDELLQEVLRLKQ